MVYYIIILVEFTEMIHCEGIISINFFIWIKTLKTSKK